MGRAGFEPATNGLKASCALYATAGSIGKTTVRTPQKVRFMRSGGQKSPHTPRQKPIAAKPSQAPAVRRELDRAKAIRRPWRQPVQPQPLEPSSGAHQADHEDAPLPAIPGGPEPERLARQPDDAGPALNCGLRLCACLIGQGVCSALAGESCGVGDIGVTLAIDTSGFSTACAELLGRL